MKKFVSILLIATLALSFTACANESVSIAQAPETDSTATPQESVSSTEQQDNEVMAGEDDELANLSDEARAAYELANGGGNQIPAGQHNGVSADNMITPILADLFTMPAKDFYSFMKDGAVYSDTGMIASEFLLKPYSMGGMDGMLCVQFDGPMDTAVNSENVKQPNYIIYYYRGASEGIFNQAKTALEEYGVESWSGDSLPDWNNLPKNERYGWYGQFMYNGQNYEAAINLLTEQEEAYYSGNFDKALGTGWPELAITISCYE